jgi:hypothetical protein
MANSIPARAAVACAAREPDNGRSLSSGIVETTLSNFRLTFVPFIEELEHADALVSIVRVAVTALEPEIVVFEIE